MGNEKIPNRLDTLNHRNMIDHVFLQRKLPGEPIDLHQTELDLLKLMTATIDSFGNKIFPSFVQRLFTNMKRLHCDHLLDEKELVKQIENLQLGEMLGVYVRAQNCGLFIRMTNEDVVTLSTFGVSLPNEKIFGEGGAVSGDIQVDYPTRAIQVKVSTMLKSVDFAAQIRFLNGTQMDRAMPKSRKSGREHVEKRNVAHPMYVCQWLIAAVSDGSTKVNTKFPVISKKVRDEIILGNPIPELPFRRSGFYIAMKVFLQLGLIIELGEQRGKFVYKIMMLKFMTKFCDGSIDADIAIQMIAKIARRIDKIQNQVASKHALGDEFIDLAHVVIDNAGKTIGDAREMLNEKFKAIQENEGKLSKLQAMLRLPFEKDIIHQIPKTLRYIEMRNGVSASEAVDNKPNPKKIFRHFWENTELPDVDLLSQVSGEMEVLQLLADIEHWILVHLDAHYCNVPVNSLRQLATKYMTKATVFYKDDCFGYSKMVLAMLKIIQIMDVIATEEYVLLLEHSSGVNPKMIKNLLLPSQFHMKIALKLQIYFEDRNTNAKYPGLLEESQVSEDSFSARFAATNDEMQSVRREILEMADRRIEEKRREWQSACDEVARMRSRRATITHDYTTDRWGESVHSSWCVACSLDNQINNYRVDLYERPLKPENRNQNAVIFELLMPPKIECLRDVLHLFVSKHYETPAQKIESHGEWKQYEQISQHARSNPENVFLGSTTKLVKRSHYGGSKHPDNVFSVFVVDNGYNCMYYGTGKKSLPVHTGEQSVKKYVTFSVENPSVYSELQWTLETTSHTQNSVLAKQSECPQKLSLGEFVNFGSLRADGHRLQLRNLYRAIETEGLSFERESVLALVMQSLWEAGPLDAARSQWYRESHEDFSVGVFGMAMIDLLEEYVNLQESNWKHPLKLIVAVSIALRVFEINNEEAHADRIAKLLIRIREIVIGWIEQIVKTIGNCPDEQSRAVVYANLMETAMCGVLTYFVSRHHQFFDKIFSDGAEPECSSVFAWLHFVVTINSNMLLRGNLYSGIKRVLGRMVYNASINAEAKLRSLIEKNPEKVYDFVRFQWSESRNQTFEAIQQCDHSPQIIFMVVRSGHSCNYVQIDIVSGVFLVNNLPVARLPKEITDNHLFQRVFGATIFEVQPSNRSFSTVYEYNEFNYIFRFENGLLIIVEQRANDNDRELIPPAKLADEIPYLLVENYSHWWDRARQIIEFRPKIFGSEDFSTPAGIEYELDMKTRHLKHLKMNKLLLDICSVSYQRIIEFLSRLDHRNYIHVLMDAPAKAKVHLMRMNLKFVIDCTTATAHDTYDVESNEYCGMRVSLDQTFGTLIGLQKGLLLESKTLNSKLFIIPHGEVSIVGGDQHVSVNVDIASATLRSPTFFIYQVNDELRQIKANSFAGWFYLAYLHAVTSHPLPDAFTGMTGTERALQILQSARVWSSSPYDTESVRTLHLIAALTPVRTFYPPHFKVIQQIEWPDAISSVAAQDSYLIVVQRLISDSQRLSQLHFQNVESEIESKTILPLNERAYERHLPYSPNSSILETLWSPRNTLTRFRATEDDTNLSAVRQLSAIYDANSFFIPNNVSNSIYRLLIGKKTLDGVSREALENVINLSTSTEFPNLWIRLYDCARLDRITRERFQLILSFLAFEGTDIDHLYILQTVMTNPSEFADIHPPKIQKYCETNRYQFERTKVENLIKSTEIGLSVFLERKLSYWGSERYQDRKYEFENEYRNEVKSVTQQITDQIHNSWPCDTAGDIGVSSNLLNVSESIRKINPILRMWNDNRKLVEFIGKFEAKLEQLKNTCKFSPSSHDKWAVFNATEKPFPKYEIDFEEKLSRNFKLSTSRVTDEVKRARKIFVENRVPENDDHALTNWWRIFKDFAMPLNEMHLIHSGLYPHLIPSLVLPMLLQSVCEQRRFVIGAIAVLTTHEQRRKRIDRFKHQPQMELILRRELENQPHVNWTPNEHPEWLLFEIEMDLSIRRIQVEIAERMIEPPGGEHSVMQLNMGEGKTAVIVPILAAVLADGKQLCSVTVLKSLFQTNLRSLRQCLGGMLNRRIYTFPCRRDMQIEAVAGKLLSIYEECNRERGIVMTLPEYRLSFQLKIYEAARNGRTEHATSFLNIHKWLNKNVRHILDESDAILDAKYQLIYTVGAQLPPDAGALRWTVVQAVLKRVPYHMRRLFQEHGEQAIEFNDNYQIGGVDYGRAEIENRPEVFRPCRLLNKSIYGELVDALIDDFLDGKLNIMFSEMQLEIRGKIREVLRNPNISREDHSALMGHLEEPHRNTILILSGLLKFEVLKLSLTKRYRVNYGVNPVGNRKMAVPFRAKDVAAEMTEFGHPDVAICLTHLSYYYSGLTDEQLCETFEVLALTENPEDIYNNWIEPIPKNLVPQSIASYNGINLSDPGQREIQLFPLLRFNTHVIDYWLSVKVFPREAKIFEGKLMCTAWDLCSEHLNHLCTGFSGTNDTQLLLPMPIYQNDLPELEATNENVRQVLLREENNYYQRLPPNVSGVEILRHLVVDGIPVLLDSGALMLELNNEQVAREWLKLVPIEKYDAAIYFSKDDILLTVDRNGFVTEFEYSVYREQLNRCLVYLDDVHTRGTDLRFPKGIRACVTLSGWIARDKTVQACMRMRMLGQGHTIKFYASLEADIGIRELNELDIEARVGSGHVVEYIRDNSGKFEKEGLVHWSAAGINYAQKLAAHKCFEESMALAQLSERCTDPENTPLIEMYGAKEEQFLRILTRNQFNRLSLIYTELEQQPISDWINAIRDGVVAKLEEHIRDVQRYTQLLDEEQEKELEHELEDEREVSRPPAKSPITPHLNPLLRELFTNGKLHARSYDQLREDNGIRPLPMALERAELFAHIKSQLSAWNGDIFVTADFLSVAELAEKDHDDEFLRPVWWIGRIIDQKATDTLILLSTFECNALLPTFRSSRKSVLHMFSPKLSITQSDLLNDGNLQLPDNSPNGNIVHAKAVQIAMFAGSMYFNDRHEEMAYCNFMGFIPRPRSADYQQAFEEGAITSTGYVPLEHRYRFAELAECRFTENPVNISVGIIERRHGYLSTRSHVCQLLVEGKRVQWDN